MKIATKEEINLLSKKMLIVGDPIRFKILCCLFSCKGRCVSEISRQLGVSIASTSYHLQLLLKEKILKKEREGKMIYYRLSNKSLVLGLKKLIFE